MTEQYPGRRLLTLALAATMGGASLAGCTLKSPSDNSPSTAAPAPRCGTLEGNNAQYGEHFGIDPNQLPPLLADDTTLWGKLKDDVTTTIQNERPPATVRFVVSAEVGYTQGSETRAKQNANTLAHLASQHLGYPIGGGPNDAYPALQDNVAVLHICGE